MPLFRRFGCCRRRSSTACGPPVVRSTSSSHAATTPRIPVASTPSPPRSTSVRSVARGFPASIPPACRPLRRPGPVQPHPQAVHPAFRRFLHRLPHLRPHLEHYSPHHVRAVPRCRHHSVARYLDDPSNIVLNVPVDKGFFNKGSRIALPSELAMVAPLQAAGRRPPTTRGSAETTTYAQRSAPPMQFNRRLSIKSTTSSSTWPWAE